MEFRPHDRHRQPVTTTNPPPLSIEQRVARLEARAEIAELIAIYCFAVDERDTDRMGACFSRDGVFRSVDGAMNASGRDAVIAQFHGRFAVLGPSNHFTHDRTLSFDAADPGRATGLVNAHAEVVRNGEALWTSLRYEDEYCLEEGRWRFRVRTLSFFYYVRPDDYPTAMLGVDRNRAYDLPRPADWPEQTSTWQRYYRDHPSR